MLFYKQARAIAMHFLKSFFDKIRRLRNARIFSKPWKFFAVVFLVAVSMAATRLAFAGFESIIQDAVGAIVSTYVSFVGTLTVYLIDTVITLAQYNDFISAPAVGNGWVIVRDVANMFFILIMIVIAFGTMLGIESVSYKKNLGALLFAAVIINFSRTICGLIIDFSQVLMLTFVSGFKDAAGGNFAEALKLNDLLAVSPASGAIQPQEVFSSILLSLMAAAVIATISLGVVIILVTTLAARIVALWILIVLSPMAFFLKAVPFSQVSGYSGKWWDAFIKNVITGPILAFFLWLSLITVQSGDVISASTPSSGSFGLDAQIGKILSSQSLLQYVISIGMLIAGVMVAGQLGGAGVGAGKALAKRIGKFAAKQVYKRSGVQNRVEAVKSIFEKKESDRKDKVKDLSAVYQRRWGRVEQGVGAVGKLAFSPGQVISGALGKRAEKLKGEAEIVKGRAEEAKQTAIDKDTAIQATVNEPARLQTEIVDLQAQATGLGTKAGDYDTAALGERDPDKRDEYRAKAQKARQQADAITKGPDSEVEKRKARILALSTAGSPEQEEQAKKVAALQKDRDTARSEAPRLDKLAKEKEAQSKRASRQAGAVEIVSSPVKTITSAVPKFAGVVSTGLRDQVKKEKDTGETTWATPLKSLLASGIDVTAQIPEVARKAGWVVGTAAVAPGLAAGAIAGSKIGGEAAKGLKEGGDKLVAGSRDYKTKAALGQKKALIDANPEKTDLDKKVKDIIEGKVEVTGMEQLHGAILAAAEKKVYTDDATLNQLADRLRETGAEQATLNTFDSLRGGKTKGADDPQVLVDALKAAIAQKDKLQVVVKMPIDDLKKMFGKASIEQKRAIKEAMSTFKKTHGESEDTQDIDDALQSGKKN